MPEHQIQTQTRLITGCDSGLGRATAQAALENGHRVAACVLAADGHSPLAEQYPERCRAYQLDVRDAERARAVVAQAESQLGGIDVLVNNAGYGLVGAAEETEPSEYRPLFEGNFFGLVEVTRAVLPGMRQIRACQHPLTIIERAKRQSAPCAVPHSRDSRQGHRLETLIRLAPA